MNDPKVTLPLKRFLLIQQCPDAWKGLDLYVFRDETAVFYAGQSYLAFARVWEHLLGGFRGHSIVGRFIWVNWPKSMKFTIELLSSQSAQFNSIGNDVTAAEQWLIQQWLPCFNVSHNSQPSLVPSVYLPPNASLRRRRSLKQLIREAKRAVQAEDNQIWFNEREE
jgi:predicted GIY-YIG superfamily endonuclease